MTRRAFTFRTAQGVWINDMRNRALSHQSWPCVTLDDGAVRDLAACMRLQAAAGFNSVTLFGLLAAHSWDPEIPRTVDRERAERVRGVLAEARACGLRVIYGLGVYSWGFDAIIAPTSPTAAFKLGEKVDDPLQMYLSDIFTIPVNLAGTCAMSVPCGYSGAGLPIGLQLIGKPFAESDILHAAYAFEQATEWHKRKANI